MSETTNTELCKLVFCKLSQHFSINVVINYQLPANGCIHIESEL
jgi:hypothetical protein